MAKSETIVDFEKVEPVVTHHNDNITIAFYQGEDLVLEVTANKYDIQNLPDMLLSNMNLKTTDDYENEILDLEAKLEEKDDLIEQYEENLQEYKDKIVESTMPF